MREVDSEKSPIVTLSAVCGAGGLIENVLTRTTFAELLGGTSVICRKAQSSPGITVRAAGVHRSDAAGTVRGRRLAPRPCRRSLSASGMDRGPSRLSQSDSRLYAVKLTEPDSITILSAYDST